MSNVNLNLQQVTKGHPGVYVKPQVAGLTAEEDEALPRVYFPPNVTNLLTVASVDPQLIQQTLMALDEEKMAIPETYDWRDKVELAPVKNQGTCGSCYSMGSAGSLSDRFRVWAWKEKGKLNIDLNPLLYVVCDKKSAGCNGGLGETVGEMMETKGAIEDTCDSWEKWCFNSEICCDPNGGCRASGDELNRKLPQCSVFDNCKPVYKAKPKSTHAVIIYKENGTDVDVSKTIEAIKANILLYGPLVCKYIVYSDFQEGSSSSVVAGKSEKNLWPKTNGVYIYNGKSPYRGGHLVSMVGWGKGQVDGYGEIPYWIVKNSWGPEWGEDGYFKIAMTNIEKSINDKVGLDIPASLQNNGQIINLGGTVSFEPYSQNDITDIKQFEGFIPSEEPSPTPEPTPDNGDKPKKPIPWKNIFKVIGIIILIFLILFLLVIIIRKIKSKKMTFNLFDTKSSSSLNQTYPLFRKNDYFNGLF